MLLSGGIDSTICVHLLQAGGHSVQGLFVDYGQAGSTQEWRSAVALADFFSIDLRRVACTADNRFGEGELQGRNGFLVFSALLLGRCSEGLLTMGIHSGTPYYDCSPAFVDRLSPIVLESSGGAVSLHTPLLSWSKGDVYAYFRATGIPTALTYSCEAGASPPCGRCASCLDRANL